MAGVEMVSYDAREHWVNAWHERDPKATSWYQERPSTSLDLILGVSQPLDAVVDVGAGASYLADHLLALGYHDVTLVDIAEAPLEVVRDRLHGAVEFVVADATTWNPDRQFKVWHDRAVFHFLHTAEDRAAYVATAAAAVPVGGHVIIGAFGTNGPTMCSGLPVRQYEGASLAAEFDPSFTLIKSVVTTHVTPNMVDQRFVFAVLQRR